MSDLLNRLAALHDAAPSAVGDDVVAADLRRGRVALVSRRRRRIATAGAATAGVVAIGSLSYAAASDNGSAQHHQAERTSTTTRPPVTSKSSPSARRTTPSHTSSAAPAIELAAYHGKQLPGYTVKRIPKGYVLQGISGSVLDVAEKGDHSDLNSFTGKIVVMLNDHPGSPDGAAVRVNGHPGRVADQDGVQILTYNDGSHNVDVQAWSNVHITREQLVRFAEGVTVLPSAQVGHG